MFKSKRAKIDPYKLSSSSERNPVKRVKRSVGNKSQDRLDRTEFKKNA